MEMQIKSSNGIQLATTASELLENRILSITGEINSSSAISFFEQFYLLLKRDSKKDITVIINSIGGEVDSGMAICDLIDDSPCLVHTICIGQAFSMASLILASGQKRSILKHSRVMIHQPRINQSITGKIDELKKADKLLSEKNIMICQYLASKTGKSFSEIEEAIKSDHYLSASQAIDFGLVHQILNFMEF